MFQKRSVFKKLLIKYLYVAIPPFLAVTAGMCFLICMEFKKNEVSTVKYALNKYAAAVNFEKNAAIEKSDYITDNLELLNILNQNYTDTYNLLDISYKIDIYINIINNSSLNTLTLYTSNKNLFESRFVSHMENLRSLSEVRQKLEQNNYMYFSDELQYDEHDNAYFVFYRKIFLDTETILCVKMYLPEFNAENCELIITEGTPETDNNIVSVNLTERYSVSANINTDRLKTQYLLCVLIFIIIAALFSLIIIAISIGINQKTTLRINAFINSLLGEDLLKIDTQTEPHPEDDFELKTIKDALRQLIFKVKKTNEEKFKADLDKKYLTLDLLQSKIDPHLLYNSLATVSHRAYKKNDMETFELIEDLVTYYRLTLAKGKETSTLGDEIDLIKKFVAINEISHAETYNLSIDIAPELAGYKIVHLILQPFVENAIIHGLAGIHREAMIKISCVMKDGFLRFKIFDNGYGMKQETLDSLQNLSAAKQGYGIKNSYDRLKLYYGDSASITFRSKPEEFTEVIILIPDVNL